MNRRSASIFAWYAYMKQNRLTRAYNWFVSFILWMELVLFDVVVVAVIWHCGITFIFSRSSYSRIRKKKNWIKIIFLFPVTCGTKYKKKTILMMSFAILCNLISFLFLSLLWEDLKWDQWVDSGKLSRYSGIGVGQKEGVNYSCWLQSYDNIRMGNR